MSKILSLFESFLDALFPKRCVGCREIGILLCPQCIATISRADPNKSSFVAAIFDYRNPIVKRAIWQLKYNNMRGLAEPLGEKLYEEIIGALGDELDISQNTNYLLVPVPLHKKRLRERGYNQSELLTRAILKYDLNHLFQLTTESLVRVRETKPQAKSDKRAERLENLRGAFEARSEIVTKKHIILIDDVVTTGATLSHARIALLHAGARSVRAYTIAH